MKLIFANWPTVNPFTSDPTYILGPVPPALVPNQLFIVMVVASHVGTLLALK